ncbi:MAG: ribonuclease Z [Saprospiraceae bacterium]
MKTFKVTILGSLAAYPQKDKITSAQIVQYDQNFILIDSGESCQTKISQWNIKAAKINTICISHLHGDHIFGLPGLLSSFQHHQRVRPLTIIGPKGIRRYVESIFEITKQKVEYEIDFLEYTLTKKLKVYSLPNLNIYAFPLEHRIDTLGYQFVEYFTEKKWDVDKVTKLNLSIDQIKKLKSGENIVIAGVKTLTSEELTLSNPLPRRYAYCSDTQYSEKIIPYIEYSDLLYHEATYLHELEEKAKERKHSTSFEAAKMAQNAKVKKLIIGHFSPRYREYEPLLKEAKEVFQETYLGLEGCVFDV